MVKSDKRNREGGMIDEDQGMDQQAASMNHVASDDDSDVSTEEEGEDLILEGVLVRNPEVDSSSDEDEAEQVEPKAKKMKTDKKLSKSSDASSNKDIKNASKVTKKTSRDEKAATKEPETITVEFTFNDMDDKYFHGIKNHLLLHPSYAPHSSALSDIMIDNVYVGTVLSTDDGGDTVFGFASILNVTTYQDQASFQDLKKLCLKHCPEVHKDEMNVVLSGKTRRPAGFFLHARMVNVPLEITLVLHEQLVKDIEWAKDHAGEADDENVSGEAQDKEEERKNLDFGAFVLLAPCSRDSTTHGVLYKNFDDEVFANFSEFVYTIEKTNESSKTDSAVNCDMVNVVVLTRTGHQKAMQELVKLIHGDN